MSRTGKNPTAQLRWSVTIAHTNGAQTFVVAADSPSDAVAAAWTQAQQPSAAARRGGAALTATRRQLHAEAIPGSEQ
jgi:hypothetical protein